MPSTAEQIKEREEALKSLVRDQIQDDENVRKGAEAAEGVAELKERIEKRSGDVAKQVDELRDLQKSQMQELQEELAKAQERLDEAETKANRRGARGDGAEVDADHVYVDMARGLAEKIREKGVTSGDRTVVQFDLAEAKGNELPDSAPGRKARRTKDMRRKDVTVVDTTVYEPDYRTGIIQPAERQITMRDLIPVVQTNSATVYHIREESFTDGAAPQSALGALKGETSFNIEATSESMKTIAHFTVVPTQLLDDISALEQHLRNRMGFLLEQEEEDQILYGNGTGQNLNGLFPQATAFDETLMTNIASPTPLDRIRMGVAQVAQANYAASGVVLGPVQWGEIELTKDGQNAYVFAAPQSAAGPRLWGLPVNATNAVQGDDFLVGAFNLAAELYEKMAGTLAISTEDGTNFRENLATVRAEERVVLAVLRPASFVEGQLANPA